MIDGQDIICQDRYRKFCKKARCVAYVDRAKAIGEARSGNSLWIERPGPPRRASSSGLSQIHLLAELLALIEPHGVGGTAIVRSDIQEISVLMLET